MFTGAVMGQYGTVLGFVGLTFSAVDCFAESFRGATYTLAAPCARHVYAQVLDVHAPNSRS